jgi:hypothetical protein
MSDPLRATTLHRDLHNPATRLGEAIQQYADTLDVAADLIAHDAAMDTAAIVLPAAADRVRILKDDELEVLDVMLDLSYGRIYEVRVDEDELIELLPGDDPEEAKHSSQDEEQRHSRRRS